MSKGNPFVLSSGKIPVHYIDRILQKSSIIGDFTDEIPSNQIYILTGIRGSGKTVMMTDIEKTLEQTGDFIVINLSIDGDITSEFASQLYENAMMKTHFLKLKFDFSLLGIGVSIEKSEPVRDMSVAIRKMLEVVKKTGKRVLVAIDEAVNNNEMRKFGSVFSIFLRTDYPVFLIMTGLLQNIYSVINAKTLTFLNRAPRIVLEPINYTMIRNTYRDVFKLKNEESEKMALATKGYSFAFQLLGYLFWEKRIQNPDCPFEDVLEEYDARLAEGAYDKIWLDLTESEQKIVKALAEIQGNDISVLRKKLKISPQQMTNIKKRLIDKGIIVSIAAGKINFSLPRFDIYLLERWV